ncbi:glycosyltransferase [Niveispirillum fermenti]|uniref:glycosyltransferase n=1 Tax=Niveispirillum fermenti TaxID=1233113 RepID=UPI003A87D75B
MHLAFFVHSLSTGGAQRRTIMLANGLAARGHRIDLVTAVDGGPETGLVGPRVMRLPLAPSPAPDVASGGVRTGDLAAAIRPLSRYLRHNRPDMLVGMANHAVIPSVLAHTLAGRPAIRLVLRASNHLSRRHDATINPRRAAEAWLWRRADAVLAVSGDVARDVVSVTGLPAGRVLTVASPILPDRLHAARRPLPAGDGTVRILAMGRFVRQKGFDTLLHAFALLSARRKARLVLAGDGPDRSALHVLADSLGIAGLVEFPGLVSNPFDRFAGADLFVLSSRWEGMPGVLVEAMALGCPVVSTDCPGGPRELLRQGALGPLVPVDDTAALADAMDAALSHPVSADALRRRVQDFTLDNATTSYETALLHLGTWQGMPRHPAGPAKGLAWQTE